MQITSPDFIDGGYIPRKFALDGDNVNPNLEIRGVPRAAKCLAFVLYNPDAPSGTFVHWLLWDIPTDTEKILPGQLPKGTQVGKNSALRNDYVGPDPASGTNFYIFKLYALQKRLDDLDPKSSEINDFMKKISGNIIAESELVGLYKKL